MQNSPKRHEDKHASKDVPKKEEVSETGEIIYEKLADKGKSKGNGKIKANGDKKKDKSRAISDNESDTSGDANLSENEYIVERVIGKRVWYGKTKYLVKWDGYETDEATWEPIENLATAQLAVEKYEESLKTHKKAQRFPRMSTPSPTKKPGPKKKVLQEDLTKKDVQTLKEKLATGIDASTTNETNGSEANPKNIQSKVDEPAPRGLKKVKKSKGRYFSENNLLLDDKNDLPSFGHFLWDKPKDIAFIDYNPSINDLEIYINWQTRENGISPQPSKISRLDVLKHDPLLLVYHYEKNLALDSLPGVNPQNLLRLNQEDE